MSTHDKVPWLHFAGAVCLVLAWLLPNHYPPWTSFYNESCAAIGLAFFVAGSRTNAGARLPASFWLIGMVALLPWAQWAAGQFPYVGDAWLSSLYLGALALAVGAGYLSSADRSLPHSLAWACLAGGLVSSYLALAQSVQLTGLGIWVLDSFDGMRPYANLGQPNNLATLIGFGFAGLLLLRASGRVTAAPAVAMAAVMILGVAVTQSRTALLYGPVCIAALWLWRRRQQVVLTRLRVVAAVTAAQWLVMYLWPAFQSSMMMAASTSLAQREGRTIRFLVWPVLVDAMSSRPWAGFGWNQVGAAELSAVDRHPPATELYLQAHNILLDLAISCGYPLAALLTIGIGYWLFTRVRSVRTHEGAAGMLVIFMFGLHAMLELPHHYAYFLIPVGLWAGIVEKDVVARAWASARWLWPTALLCAAGTWTIWIDYPRFEEEFRLVRFEGARIRTTANPEPMPSNPAFSSLTAFLAQARRAPSKGMTDTELRAMRDSVERYPYAASLKRYAIALFLNGRADEARHEFLQIRQLYGPKSYRLYRKELSNDIAADGLVDLEAFERSLPE